MDDLPAKRRRGQEAVRLPLFPSLSSFSLADPSFRHRIAAEVAAGLGLYFNKALGNNLLYRFERGQYAEHYKKLQGTDRQMSSVYGGEHLLRLFGSSSLSS
jgi:hypothetical protein